MRRVRQARRSRLRSPFHAQLPALQQLQREFPVRILLSYLVRYKESQHRVGEVRRFLPPSAPVGAMVETPAAALDQGN